MYLCIPVQQIKFKKSTTLSVVNQWIKGDTDQKGSDSKFQSRILNCGDESTVFTFGSRVMHSNETVQETKQQNISNSFTLVIFMIIWKSL